MCVCVHVLMCVCVFVHLSVSVIVYVQFIQKIFRPLHLLLHFDMFQPCAKII